MTLSEKILEVLNEGYPGKGRNFEKEPAPQGSSQKPETQVLDKGSQGGKISKSALPLRPKAADYEEKPEKMGSSEDAETEELDVNTPGASASAKAKKMPVLRARAKVGANPVSTGVEHSATDFSRVGNVLPDGLPSAEGREVAEEVISERTTSVDAAEKAAEKAATKATKGKAYRKLRKEDVDAGISGLFEGDVDLSEDFKTKASGLFETLLEARVSDEVEAAEEAILAEAAEAVKEIRESLIESVNAYLDEAVTEWLAENEVAITTSIRADIAESFLDSVRDALIEHNIDVPEDRVDLVESLEETVTDLEGRLSEQSELAESALAELIAIKKEIALATVTEGLADTEADKIRSLMENIEFEDDESFTSKLSVIRESYFKKTAAPKTLTEDGSETPKSDDAKPTSDDHYITGAVAALKKLNKAK